MGDLYKCKNCGQFLYGAGVPEISGEDAMNVLRTIERLGFYDSPKPVPFLESDFVDFLSIEPVETGIRYSALPSFYDVIANMRFDGVMIATKRIEEGRETVSCSVCNSHNMFHVLGNLPTTFIEGRWDDYVESDHTWYILSDSPLHQGALTELEKRELFGYINRENRQDVQIDYDDMIQAARARVKPAKGDFARQQDVNLTNYFKVLLNIKTDIQLLESRLFDLLVEQVDANRDFVNSTSKSEETIAMELEKSRNSLDTSIARLESELVFNIRDDWAEVYQLRVPEQPVRPVMPRPVEPEYKQSGLFNRRAIQAENDALRAEYLEKKQRYDLVQKQYKTALENYKQACADYEVRKRDIFEKEREAWLAREDNVFKQAELESLREKRREVAAGEKDPLSVAEKTLANSGPAKIKNLIDSEIDKNTALLAKAYQIEADLQTVMFVFPKYLDILAVSKIYEYLVTGRVTQLTGANGAYKLYESEMRAGRSNFSNEEVAFNDMAKREYTIYSMLSSVSNVINDITDKTIAAIDEIHNSTDTEAQNEYHAAMESYYSLINQELDICTEFLSIHRKSASGGKPDASSAPEDADPDAKESEQNEAFADLPEMKAEDSGEEPQE